MRYPDGGGLTAAERARRERVRARRPLTGSRPARPTGKSRGGCGCNGCRPTGGRRWRPGPLATKGAQGAECKLTVAQLAELDAALDAGPAAWGWDEDQCWTLARIADLVRRRSRVEYTPTGIDVLLHRIGWSVQVPARRSAERGEVAAA